MIDVFRMTGSNVSLLLLLLLNIESYYFFTAIAISPNNNEVHIYKREGSSWTLSNVLRKHDLRVMGIDWAPNTSKLLSNRCDRLIDLNYNPIDAID